MTAKKTEPKGCTSFKTRQLARLLSRQYDAEIAKAGLKGTQFSMLCSVPREGSITPGELAQTMGLDASTVTRNLQPLVEAGWLVLEAGNDARSRHVRITAQGYSKLVEAASHWELAQQSINSRLGVERVIALHDLLDECISLLDVAREK